MKLNLFFAAAVLVFAVSGAAWYVTSHDRAGAMARNTPNAASLQELAKGPIANFTLISDDKTAPDLPFVDGNGKKRKLSDFRGKILLVNFWATWCAPCRKEMPSLDALKADLGGADFDVLPISLDHSGAGTVRQFLASVKATHVGVYVDPTGRLGRSMDAFGLPMTVLISRQGREIGHLIGPADWNSKAAEKLIRTAIAAKL